MPVSWMERVDEWSIVCTVIWIDFRDFSGFTTHRPSSSELFMRIAGYRAMLPWRCFSVTLRGLSIQKSSKFMSAIIGSKPMAIWGKAARPSPPSASAFSTAVEEQDEGELYPDIDAGSLFCINHGRCFLLDGKLCSTFQHTGRARAVLHVRVPRESRFPLDPTGLYDRSCANLLVFEAAWSH